MSSSSSSDSDSDNETRLEVSSVKPPPYVAGSSPAPYTAPYPHTSQVYQQQVIDPPPTGPGAIQQTGYYATNAQGQHVYVTQVTKTNHSTTFNDLRGAIPIMPMPLAVLCFILNICLPGFGTITASFSVLCCAGVGLSSSGKLGCFCLNFWIGWVQFLTVWIFLFGWIWSIFWGWAFIAASSEYYNRLSPGTTTTVITETPVTMISEPTLNKCAD